MNDLQRVQLDILKEFIRICDELGLTYFLVCGSALGAAKYEGYIPWDDDLDVALTRKDYEIFCENAQGMLPKHLFVQNHCTDKNYPLIFSKIRNSNTTFIEKTMSGLNINHGIYIDVFPLDGYPEDVNSQNKIEKEKKHYLWIRLCCLKFKHTLKSMVFVTLQKLFGVHRKPYKFVQRLENVIKQYPAEKSSIWCNHGNWQGKKEYAAREQYGEGAWANFEGLKVRIPEKYDEYLTQKYGDWRADLPEEQKIGHHYNMICDINRSYKEYIEKSSKHRIRVKK